MKTFYPDSFKWARCVTKVADVDDGGNEILVTTAICEVCEKVPANMFPHRKPPTFYGKPTEVSRTRQGNTSLRWEKFKNHEKTKAHEWACGKSSASSTLLQMGFSKKSSGRDEEKIFQQNAVFFATCDETPTRAAEFGELERMRGNKDAKADPNDAWRVCLAMRDAIREQNFDFVKKSFAASIILDDGSGCDIREWCAIAMSTDCFAHPSLSTAQVMFALVQLNWDELDAPGMCSVLQDVRGIDWDKVYWIGRDGASVMKSLSGLLIENLAPFAFDVWCSNHLCALLMRDCVFGVPEFHLVVDKLSEIDHFFRFSNKSRSRLQDLIPVDHSGPSVFKRAENLTRWPSLCNACDALITLHNLLIPTLIAYIEDPAEQSKVEKVDKAENIFVFFSSFHNMAIVVILRYFGQAFKNFHEALQERKNDFTRRNRELRILKGTVLLALEPDTRKRLVSETEQLLVQVGCIEGFFDMEDDLDVEVRAEDADPHLVASVVSQYTHMFVESFQDSVEVRFPESRERTVPEAFEIFNPESFPSRDDPELKTFEEKLLSFGTEDLPLLVGWYGTAKQRGDTEVPPVVNAELCTRQWPAFREYMFTWYTQGNVTTLPELIRKTRSEAKGSVRFMREFSEIIKLLQIVDVHPDSTAECERIMHTAKRVMTKERTRLSPDSYEACVMVSHESRRRYGARNKHEICELLPAAQKFLKKYRLEFSKKVQEAKKRKIEANNAGKKDGGNGAAQPKKRRKQGVSSFRNT